MIIGVWHSSGLQNCAWGRGRLGQIAIAIELARSRLEAGRTASSAICMYTQKGEVRDWGSGSKLMQI
jgi:hypothetical protein